MRTRRQEPVPALDSTNEPGLAEAPPALPVPAPRAEATEPGGPAQGRVAHHPGPYALRGMPVWCTECGARRDWAFLNKGRDVWVVCRCGNVWLEPEMGRSDIDALGKPGSESWASAREALTALGFDGAFRGMYLG